MSELIPQLIPPLVRFVVEYYDDFAEGTLQCVIWDSGAKDFDDFQTKVAPHMAPRIDDYDVFANRSYVDARVNIVEALGQLYRAGLSFFPQTIWRIANYERSFADWLAGNFPCQLKKALIKLRALCGHDSEETIFLINRVNAINTT